MNAVRTYTQINSLGNLILENLPFKKGEFVEVLVIPAKNEEFGLTDEWELLFKDIQNNEVSKNIGDEDITQEINLYRKKL
jgi:hypothetical protein